MSCTPARPVVTDRPGVGLVVGRDPSNTTWLVVRYAEDWDPAGWTNAQLDGLVYDSGRRVLELAPLPPVAMTAASTRLPIEVVESQDGRRYRSRPSRHRVEVQPPQEAWRPLPCFGGKGAATGQLRRPQGLAVDRLGRLYVADSGNHRVQVVRPDGASVVEVLGWRDGFGRFVAGTDRGAMTEPVDVAVHRASGRIAVADRAAGRVHLFDHRFAWCTSFEPAPSLERPGGALPRPVALAWRDDGTLLVADAHWPRLLLLDAAGGWLGEASLQEADHPRFEGLALASDHEPVGTAVLGPLDSGIHGVAWHDIRIEAEVPSGAAITVQTWATDDPTAPPPAVPERWAPSDPVPVDGGDTDFEAVRLVQSDWTAWQDWLATDRSTPPPAGTDRGRYLWLRVTLTGRPARSTATRATATPSLRGLRLRFPRPSWLQWLPSQWSRRDEAADPAGALFVERFLAMFERVLTDAEAHVEDLPRRVSADTAPSGWLEWIASWLALSFDPSWPEDRRRALLREAMSLYKRRGTVHGLTRYVEIYTGRAPVLVEGFATRQARRPAVLGCDEPLGCTILDATPARTDGQAHRFTLYVHLDDPSRQALVEPVVRRIVDTEKPAHTDYDLQMVLPDARVGCQSTVGIDLVLGHGAAAEPLDDDAGPDGSVVLRGDGAPQLDNAGLDVGDTRLT